MAPSKLKGALGFQQSSMDQSAWNSEPFLETVGLGDFKGHFQRWWHQILWNPFGKPELTSWPLKLKMLPHAGDHRLGGKDALASAWVIETLTAKKQWSLEMSVWENWAIVTCWSQSHFFPLFPTIPHWNSIHPSCYLKWALGLLQEGLSSPGDLRWLLQSRAMAPLSASTQSSHTGHRAKIKSLLFKSESKTYFSMAGSSRTG